MSEHDMHQRVVEMFNDRTALSQPITLQLKCAGDLIAVAIALEMFGKECTLNGAHVVAKSLHGFVDQISKAKDANWVIDRAEQATKITQPNLYELMLGEPAGIA